MTELLPAQRQGIELVKIEGLSFDSFRRIATTILLPGANSASVLEMVSIGSVDLADAQRIDASALDE